MHFSKISKTVQAVGLNTRSICQYWVLGGKTQTTVCRENVTEFTQAILYPNRSNGQIVSDI